VILVTFTIVSIGSLLGKLAGRRYEANEPRTRKFPMPGHRDAIRGDPSSRFPPGHIGIPDREGSEPVTVISDPSCQRGRVPTRR